MSNVDASKLAHVEAQAMASKPHSHLSICWGFFVLNDSLIVDLVKPQMLQCIICRCKQASNDVLAQIFTFCEHLIKYNNVNGITLMTIHVQIAHPRLFSQRKHQLNDKVAKPTIHVQQSGKKKTTTFGYVIISFLVPQTLTKKLMKTNNNFWRIWLQALVNLQKCLVS
jgi:hypothetical protein